MEHYEQSHLEALLGRDAELASLWQEHLAFKNRIHELESLAHMTPLERFERKQLQKRKLAGKDRIARIVVRLRHV